MRGGRVSKPARHCVDRDDSLPCAYANRPWQCLYFLPEPQGHASLRPTLPQLVGSRGLRSAARAMPLLPLPTNAGASGASANAIWSSPVDGSTLWASMYGRFSWGGGSVLI